MGNLEHFLSKLENINCHHKTKPTFVICGDMDTDYHSEGCHRSYMNITFPHNNSKLLQHCEW
jgi:hypothetical protein